MTKAELRTELQATGFGLTSPEVIRQNEWLKAAYTWVWNAAEWSFKQVDMTSLAVTAGDSTPTMPSDFGTVRRIFDNQGSELRELDPDAFEREFQAGIISGERGNPWAFKVVNRQYTLGPTPSASATFQHSYERRICHLETDGSTITAGFMDEDDDLPLWPVDHHMILVYHAAMVGHGMNSNPAAVTFQGLRDDHFEAMLTDLVAEKPVGRQYGRADWS